MQCFDLYIGHNYNAGLATWSRAEILAAIENHARESGITGYTITDGVGCWQGQTELTTIVTVFDCGTTENTEACVGCLAQALAATLKQECVLVATSICGTKLVGAA